MSEAPPLPALDVGPVGRVLAQTRASTRLALGGRGVEVLLRRSLDGPLRECYPCGRHDIEIRVEGVATPDADALRALVALVLHADPECRRVVYPVPAGAAAALATGQAAGLQPVVEVEADDELALLVAEPDWLAAVPADVHHLPGT